MIKDKYSVIGVMSGTSLDGIDLVHVTFKFNSKWSFKILQSETVPYSGYWTDTLKQLTDLKIEDLRLIDEAYTEYLARVIQNFIDKHNIKDLDAICSHGHTALHKPEDNLTYQIGNKPKLSKLLNNTVVCDFRIQDVKLGGQGAPLVPIGDKLLFSDFDFCLNLGGFANISLDLDGIRIAYDICPVNIVLNHYTKILGYSYDNEGEIAASGNVNENLLQQLNQLDFYSQPHPKSLGLEWVKSNVFPIIDSFQLQVKDVLSTFCEHIAIQISNEINKKSNASVLVTGGGAYNTYLINRIKHFSKHNLVTPSKEVIEFKEAVIFGFLGVLKLRNQVNCLKSVTGASNDHVTGVIFQP